MLSLESPRWAALDNAYADREDIPALLRRLTVRSKSEDDEEPWFSIWSALAHQGDVYSASFAAVPHIVHLLSTDPIGADQSFFHFPTWVEICRTKASVPIPEDLQADYSRRSLACHHWSRPQLSGNGTMISWPSR